MYAKMLNSYYFLGGEILLNANAEIKATFASKILMHTNGTDSNTVTMKNQHKKINHKNDSKHVIQNITRGRREAK
jgi:hypothetical protein